MIARFMMRTHHAHMCAWHPVGMLYLIDVSHHNGSIDWGRVARGGITGAIIKATQGTGYVDPRYTANATGARKAGLVTGAYHFLTHGSATAQCDHFLGNVGDPDGLLIALDVEQNGVTASDVTDWCTRWRELHPTHPLLIYCAHASWHQLTGDLSGARYGHLWAARYPYAGTGTASALWKRASQKSPGLPWGGWTSWILWQYSDRADVPGVSGHCDVSVYAGTTSELAELTTSQEDDMPITSTDVDAIAAACAQAVWRDDLNIRLGGSTPNADNIAARTLLQARSRATQARNIVNGLDVETLAAAVAKRLATSTTGAVVIDPVVLATAITDELAERITAGAGTDS